MKILLPVSTALIGLLVGGTLVEIFHRYEYQLSKEAFAQRQTCKGLADRFVHQFASAETTLTLTKVGYSTASNSCFAAVESFTHSGAISLQEWKLVDLLSGEETLAGACILERDCGNGSDVRSLNELDSLFKSAIDGKKPPIDIHHK